MRRRLALPTLAIPALLLLLATPQVRPQEPPPDFQPLWNGKDFSGWDFRNCTKEDWATENGILSTRAGKVRANTWILTQALYDDFELRLEFLLTKGADSGLAIRTAATGPPHLKGIEIQLVDDALSKNKPLETTGALWGVKAPMEKAAKPLGEWNQLHLTVNERKLKLVLNGVTVQDVDLSELKGPEGLKSDAGHIGLQTRLGVAKFRNVFIKPLSEAPPPGKITLALDAGGHTARIDTVFFTKDGKQLVTGSADHTVRVWDVATGRPLQVLRPPGIAVKMDLSPTEDKVAVASKYYVGKIVHHVIYLMRLGDGQIEWVLKGHKDRVLSLAYSRDGKCLASSSDDKTVRIWDPATGKDQRVIEHGRDPAGGLIALSPTGDRVACLVAGGDTLIFDAATGKSLATLPKPAGTHRYYGIDWSPDGKTIVTSTWGDRFKDGSLGRGFFLWNPDGTQLPKQPEGPFRTNGVTFSKDGSRLLVTWAGDRLLTTFDPGEYHRATIIDLETGKPGASFEPRKILVPGYHPPRGSHGGALSPDGKLAATLGGAQGLHEAFVWQTSDGKLVHRLAARGWLRPEHHAAWSPDGQNLAWGFAKDKTRPVFHLGELRLGTTTSPSELRGQSLKEGVLTLERQEPNKRHWEMQVVKESQVMARLGVPHVPSAVTFVGPDRVAMASDYGRFFLHDVALQKPVLEFKTAEGRIPKTSRITSIAPSPTKTPLLATIGVDQMMRIWSTERDRPLLTLYVHGEDWIIWTEEGYYAATPGGERLIGWTVDNGIDKAADFYPAEQFRKKLYRPDVIKLVLEKGSVEEALKTANLATGIKQDKTAEIEKLLPPGVTITVDQSKLPVVTVKVQARAAVAEQPIKSLRLMVDGLRLPDGQADVNFEVGKEPATHETTWTVKLPPGSHRLSVLALSKDYTPNLSNQFAVRCPAVGTERPAIHHVAVGVSKYRTVTPDLKFADKDARDLKQSILATAKNGLAYRPGEAFELLNQDATRDAVLGKIDAVRKKAQPGDLLVMSFAGHGVRDGGEFFLLTHEADQTSADTLKKTAISGAALREKLATFPCQVLVLLDACHAGAVGGMAGGSDDAARSLSDVDLRVAVMCAALGHEKAKEDRGNGLFTAALIRALQRDPEAFFDRATGEMTVYHLTAFVEQEVRKRSDGMQNPYLKMPLAHPAFNVAQFAQTPPGMHK